MDLHDRLEAVLHASIKPIPRDILPFRIQHATTDPEKARRDMAATHREVARRLFWIRARRWAWRHGMPILVAGVLIALFYATTILMVMAAFARTVGPR